MLMNEVLNIECLGIVRGMSPMEAVKEPLKTILILIGLLNFLKASPASKQPFQRTGHSNIIYERLYKDKFMLP